MAPILWATSPATAAPQIMTIALLIGAICKLWLEATRDASHRADCKAQFEQIRKDLKSLRDSQARR